MGVTSIEWTDRSVNPIRARNKITGAVGHYCVKISPECANCYASGWQPRFKMPVFQEQVKLIRNGDIEVFLDQSRLQEVLRRREPTKWFWCDMTDMFGDWVPEEYIDQCFAVMANTPHHTHQVLTKRPERMREYITKSKRVLPNVWLIVSAGTQKQILEFMPLLRETPAAVRGLSVEPLLEPLDLYEPLNIWWNQTTGQLVKSDVGKPALDWVIVGGESGPKARPMHPDWVRSLREQCTIAGVPFFFKQYGEFLPICDYYEDDDAFRDDALDAPHVLLTRGGHIWHVGTEGTNEPHDGQPPSGTWIMHRIGKKAAGRLLDGRTWDEFPK